MPQMRERFQPWIERRLRPQFPELAAPLMTAIDAFDAIHERGELTQDNLDRLVEAVSSSRRPLYGNVCGLMQVLSARWQQVTAAILQMSMSSKAHIRFNAILCLGEDTPSDVVDSVLKRGFTDRSVRVRSKAADWAGRLRNQRLVPELTAALAAEKDPKASATIEFELRLLRDGYILKRVQPGHYTVTVHDNRGGCRCEYIDEARLKSEGLDTIVANLRLR